MYNYKMIKQHIQKHNDKQTIVDRITQDINNTFKNCLFVESLKEAEQDKKTLNRVINEL